MNGNAHSTELTTQEMYQWKADESTYTATDIDGKITSIIDQAYRDFIEGLISIETFVGRILPSDTPAFRMTDKIIERNDLKIVTNDLKRYRLANYFTSVIKLFAHYSPEYLYSPNVELFFHCCFKLELGKELFTDPLGYTTKRGDKPMRQFELYNSLLTLIRTESRNHEFDGKIHSRQYNAERNLKSAVSFLRKLFARRLLVLRVDFYYLPKHANCISVEEARKDLAHFLYNLRRNKELSENLEGYIWKIEFTPLKKLHFHMLFLLDSSTVQNDEFWANKFGTYWSEVITQGRGRFYNGNTKGNKRKFEINGMCGIGKIGRIHAAPADDSDIDKRNILLNRIVVYMLKPDQVLLTTKLCNGKHRLYGKGVGRNSRRKG
ncbi:MAG: inovirus-type Gp2 protein [Methylococcales bacterium]|nr:inovirus-type Gp2 protein [Methylococcales bacterium]